MEDMAAAMGRSAQFCYPNLAVDFSEPEKRHINKFGAEQQGCRFCGECDIGCNFHAKNTLDFNYLKVAANRGADIETQCEVTRIEQLPDGQYRVSFKDHLNSGQDRSVSAKYVFVCAGAVNSSELLLRCRDQYRTLRHLSQRLGSNYSGNGDFLAFAFNTTEPFKPSEGPTITTGIVYSRKDGDADNWFIFQEGGYPKEIGALLQVLNPRQGFLKDLEVLARVELENLLRRSRNQPGDDPNTDHSAVFLAMGRDRANGRISLHPLTFSLDIEWPLQPNMALYGAEDRFVEVLA
jgi:cholesterol oxidase